MAPLPIQTLIDGARELLNVEPWVARGALNERTGSLEPSEARTIIEAWLGRAIPEPGGGGGVGLLGTLRAPVHTLLELPSDNNNLGDLRLVLTGMALYGWDGAGWSQVAGGGGGGGTGADQINLTAVLTGITTGDVVVWDATNTRFKVGELVAE